MFQGLRLVRGAGVARRNTFSSYHYYHHQRTIVLPTITTATRTALNRHRPVPKTTTANPASLSRSIHATTALRLAITPDSSTPAPPSTTASHVAAPANISTEEYHELADDYLDHLVSKLEALSEQRDDVDVEYN
ncbi:hypothetical protein FGG08_007602, partial [Glutinoglossum americanum]